MMRMKIFQKDNTNLKPIDSRYNRARHQNLNNKYTIVLIRITVRATFDVYGK